MYQSYYVFWHQIALSKYYCILQSNTATCYVNAISRYKFATCFDIAYHPQVYILLHAIISAMHYRFFQLRIIMFY